MMSKPTNSKACTEQKKSEFKNYPNPFKKDKKLLFKKWWYLILILFIFIAILLSIENGKTMISSIYSQRNEEKFEEAAKTAKLYWRFAPLYREDIIDDLIYKGFTYEEAVYGLEANGY